MATPGVRYCNLDRAQLESLEEKKEIKELLAGSHNNNNNIYSDLSGSSRAALTYLYLKRKLPWHDSHFSHQLSLSGVSALKTISIAR